MKPIAIEQLGQIPLEQEADLLNAIDAAMSTDEGGAVSQHLAAGRAVYFREPLTPPGLVIRKNPDGSCQWVRFASDGSELVVSEAAAA
ncbi:hypothetical protein [Achromobacter pestifer]